MARKLGFKLLYMPKEASEDQENVIFKAKIINHTCFLTAVFLYVF